jgi:threonyl-tRNA synthetase
VIGDKEAAEDGVSPRTRGGEDWKIMKVSEFVARTRDEIGLPRTKRRK